MKPSMEAATAAAAASAAATAYNAYKAGKDIYNTGKDAIGKLSEVMSVIDDLKDRSVTALTAYAKKTLISSRVYVEDELANEDLTPKLMKMLNSMYSGFIMCVAGLNSVSKDCTIANQMRAAIGTEAFMSFKDLAEKFGDPSPALEDNNQKPEEKNGDGENKDNKSQKIDFSSQEKDLKAESARLFCGHLLELKIPDGNGGTVPLYFYVQLLPQVIPGLVMQEFMRGNASPDRSLRWAMYKAGEISFWKDFVFECDRVAKRKKALKVDKDGFLREMEDRRSAALKKKIVQMKDKAQRRRNLCNSIIICTKRSLDNVCKDVGINMKSYSQRDEFLNDMMAMMLCVVDTNYGTVDLYMNGIEGRGEYTAKMIEGATKSKDGIDVKDIITLVSAGSMPARF